MRALKIPEVRGADIKFFRQKCLKMSVNEYAGLFGVTRQHVARLERLTRPLTRDEIMSIPLDKPGREGRVGKAR